MKFQVDLDKLTVDDLIQLETNQFSMLFTRDLLARFMVSDDGKPVELEEAKKALGKLSISQMRQASEQFAEAMRGMSLNPTISAA